MADVKDRLRIKLPDETKKRLESFVPDLDEAERSIKVLKGIGMDTTDLEDKVKWARDTAQTLLKEFG